MFTTGSATSGTATQDQGPEVTEKTTIEKLAHALWHVLNRKERAENEMQTRKYRDQSERGPDPDAPPLTEADIARLIRTIAVEQGLGGVHFGNEGPPPEKNKRDQLAESISQIIQKLLILAIGFVFGALWNHETRISHLEGREVPSVRSP